MPTVNAKIDISECWKAKNLYFSVFQCVMIVATYYKVLFCRIRVVSAVGRFGRVVSAWVVSAFFGGELIRPILVGRFDRESFRPWVVSASLNIGAKSTYFCS